MTMNWYDCAPRSRDSVAHGSVNEHVLASELCLPFRFIVFAVIPRTELVSTVFIVYISTNVLSNCDFIFLVDLVFHRTLVRMLYIIHRMLCIEYRC